jgi:hypothetical protein
MVFAFDVFWLLVTIGSTFLVYSTVDESLANRPEPRSDAGALSLAAGIAALVGVGAVGVVIEAALKN